MSFWICRRSYRIIAYGWLEFVWQYEWFIIRRDTLSGTQIIFAMYTIVYDLDNCLCCSKDAHLFALCNDRG